MLSDFSESLPVEGRVEIEILDEVDVSIVNPSQYRNKLIKLITEDTKTVTSSLGADYRVVISGIDSPVQWVKSGAINLSLYIPYSYTVIPTNVNSVFLPEY